MAKKIYDIKPPKVANKVEETIASMGVAPKKRGRKPAASRARKTVTPPVLRPPVMHQHIIKRKEKRFPLKEVLFGGTIAIVLLAIYLFITLPAATVTISPKVEAFSSQEKLVADKKASTVALSEKAIPAQYIEEQKEGSQQFAATGSASDDGKATGTITVYNKVSPSTPIVLKEGTHFLSDSGKYFISLDRITIPAMQGKTAGSVRVKVEAEESGEDSNIGASQFSVPKLSGTAYYYGIWAESTAAMTGGKTGSVKKVTADDVSKARDAITKKLLDEAESVLRAKLSADDIVLENAISKTVISATADTNVGTITETFSESAKVRVSMVVFKKQDLEKYVKESVVAKIPKEKQYLETKMDIKYTADSIDTQAGIIRLTVDYSVGTYLPISTNALIDSLPGQNAGQIEGIVAEKYPTTVNKTEVNFWPFWVNKAPGDKDKITINFNFE